MSSGDISWVLISTALVYADDSSFRLFLRWFGAQEELGFYDSSVPRIYAVIAVIWLCGL